MVAATAAATSDQPAGHLAAGTDAERPAPGSGARRPGAGRHARKPGGSTGWSAAGRAGADPVAGGSGPGQASDSAGAGAEPGLLCHGHGAAGLFSPEQPGALAGAAGPAAPGPWGSCFPADCHRSGDRAQPQGAPGLGHGSFFPMFCPERSRGATAGRLSPRCPKTRRWLLDRHDPAMPGWPQPGEAAQAEASCGFWI